MNRGHLDRLEDILRAAPRGRPLSWVWTASRDIPLHWERAIFEQMEVVRSFILDPQLVVVHHGDARGGDKLVHLRAGQMGFQVRRYPVTSAEWNAWGGIADHQRNARMLEAARPDLLSAIIHRRSRGATGCRDNALARGVPCITITEEGLLVPRLPSLW